MRRKQMNVKWKYLPEEEKRKIITRMINKPMRPAEIAGKLDLAQVTVYNLMSKFGLKSKFTKGGLRHSKSSKGKGMLKNICHPEMGVFS